MVIKYVQSRTLGAMYEFFGKKICRLAHDVTGISHVERWMTAKYPHTDVRQFASSRENLP